MCDNNVAISLIRDYINRIYDNNHQEKDGFIDDHYAFEEDTMTEWAAGDILNDILEHPFRPAVDTIDEAMIRYELRYYEVESPRSKRLFAIARDTAAEIGLMLI